MFFIYFFLVGVGLLVDADVGHVCVELAFVLGFAACCCCLLLRVCDLVCGLFWIGV